MTDDRKLVHRVEPGDDRRQVYATTYQMRNFYKQLRDGLPGDLDIFNYVQHHQVTRWAHAGTRLLDVCCGRGLLLPLLRYHRKDLGSYTGIDIKPANAVWTHQRVTDGRELTELGETLESYYPFPVRFVEGDAAHLSTHLPGEEFDLIVYTSSLEHMHPEAGLSSLEECRRCARVGTMLLLTTPRTEEGRSGYDTRYRAHVYEWTRDELAWGLDRSGWEVRAEYGLTISMKDLRLECARAGLLDELGRLLDFVPPEWVRPLLAPLFPARATEVGFVCRAVEQPPERLDTNVSTELRNLALLTDAFTPPAEGDNE